MTRRDGQRGQLAYRPGLDGVRAVAVLVVIIFHLSGDLGAGFLGVNVFFVLSGFLITSILLAEWTADGRIGLRNFYVRRALRLLPAMFVAVAIALPACLAVATFRQWAEQAVFAIFYVFNFFLMARNPVREGLNHLWSLSVEEQFYIVWAPLLVLLLRRRINLRLAISALLVGVIAVRIGLIIKGENTFRIYVSPLSADQLFVGVLAAVMLAHRNTAEWLRRIATTRNAWIAFGLLTVAFVFLPSVTSAFYPLGGYTLVALVAVVVIVNVYLRPDESLGRTLAVRPMVWLGRRSYAAYLYHVPFLTLAGAYVHGRLAIAAIVAPATLIAIELSYRYVEQPFLRLKDRFEPRPSAEMVAPVAVDGTAEAVAG